MSSQPVVEVSHLVVNRGGAQCGRDVSFTVGAGVVMGLLGPSGCGKTTLMRSVVGVQIVAGGTVQRARAARRQRRAARPDRLRHPGASVYDDLTVAENLRFFARVLGVSGDEVARCVAAVDLADQRDKVVDQLSGGQRSRVVARGGAAR